MSSEEGYKKVSTEKDEETENLLSSLECSQEYEMDERSLIFYI